MRSASAQCRVQADGGTVRLAVVVGSEMHRRRIAGSSALRGEAPQQTAEQAESSLVAHGEYRSAPRCCGDVKVSQRHYSFGDPRDNITPLGCRHIYSLCCTTTITPLMIGRQLLLDVASQYPSPDLLGPAFPSCLVLPSWLILS